MRIAILSALLGAAVYSAALAEPSNPHSAQTAPAAPPASSPVPAPNSKEVICVDRIATGSRLAYARDCHTQAEWDTIARASQDLIVGIQSRGLTTNNCPMGSSTCNH